MNPRRRGRRYAQERWLAGSPRGGAARGARRRGHHPVPGPGAQVDMAVIVDIPGSWFAAGSVGALSGPQREKRISTRRRRLSLPQSTSSRRPGQRQQRSPASYRLCCTGHVVAVVLVSDHVGPRVSSLHGEHIDHVIHNLYTLWGVSVAFFFKDLTLPVCFRPKPVNPVGIEK